MWPKTKKEQEDYQERLEDYELDLQSLREERDELKAWCAELESRQCQQLFGQRVFEFWTAAMAELRRVQQGESGAATLLGQKNQEFLQHHLHYSDKRKALLTYVDRFTDTYKQVNHSHEKIVQIKAQAMQALGCAAEVDSLAEQLRLLSLNIAIESSHTDKQQLSDSVISTLRELSDSSRRVATEISSLNEGISSDSELAGNYFSTVTEGFVGFSQAISPLVAAADRSSELIMELGTIASEWATDNLFQAMKVGHILWKFDLYSQVLGLGTGPSSHDGGLAASLGSLQGGGDTGVKVERALVRAGELSAEIQQQHSEGNTDAVLAGLDSLEQATAQLFECFDKLRVSLAG